jgi:hypothetical protein
MHRLPPARKFNPDTGPQCAWCREYLEDAPLTLSAAIDGVHFDDSLRLILADFDVDCPSCSRPNKVRLLLPGDSTQSGEVEALRTDKDKRYLGEAD